MLICGDCLDVMAEIADGSVDLILADLPYGTTACKWDTVIPFAPLWAHYKRVIKRNGAIVLTASQPFTSALVMSNAAWFRYEWIWRKNEGTGAAWAKRQPMRYHEHVVVFYGAKPTYNPQRIARWSKASKSRYRTPVGAGRGTCNHGTLRQIGVQYDPDTKGPESVLKFRSVANGGGGKLHPTQKPVALMEYLIRTYTNAGELVLDNTMGSGTTGVACINTGRRFIGIEKDPEIFATAKARIEAVQPQLIPA
jgi:DNA modification methylase